MSILKFTVLIGGEKLQPRASSVVNGALSWSPVSSCQQQLWTLLFANLGSIRRDGTLLRSGDVFEEIFRALGVIESASEKEWSA